MKKFAVMVFVLITLSLLLVTTSATQLRSQDFTSAQAAADQWKNIVDTGAWDRAWDSAGSTFKTMITRDYWRGIMAGRALSGDVMRSRLTSTVASSLPGFPDGQYFVFRYDVDFRDRSRGTDIVAVRSEGGTWQVASYRFIAGNTRVGVQPLSER